MGRMDFKSIQIDCAWISIVFKKITKIAKTQRKNAFNNEERIPGKTKFGCHNQV